MCSDEESIIWLLGSIMAISRINDSGISDDLNCGYTGCMLYPGGYGCCRSIELHTTVVINK